MSVDCRAGELRAEFRNELDECGSLRLGACVLGLLAVSGAAADVADADRVCVVALCVGADFLNRSPTVDGAVEIDNEVIADVAPAVAFDVPLADLLDREMLAFGSGSAMDNDFRNGTHFLRHSAILSVARIALIGLKIVDFSHNDYGFIALAL